MAIAFKLFILLSLANEGYASAVQKRASPIAAIIEIANSALSIFTTVSDLFQTSTERNELENLTRQIIFLKESVNNAISLLRSLAHDIFKLFLRVYINTIESCEIDYRTYMTNPTDAAKNNLLKCHYIMQNVRPLGNYLRGEPIHENRRLFDFYIDEDGVCDGQAIESVLKNLFAEYVIGCNIAITIEYIENDGKSGHYANECEGTMSKIIKNTKHLYKDCARHSYKNFTSSVQTLFKNVNALTSLKDLHANLSAKYPWFEFIIIQMSKSSKAKLGGNFSVAHFEINSANFTFALFVFDRSTKVSMEKQNFSLAIDVDEKDYKGHYFGNSPMLIGHFAGLPIRIVGFAQENNLSCNNTKKYACPSPTQEKTENKTSEPTDISPSMFPGYSNSCFITLCGTIAFALKHLLTT